MDVRVHVDGRFSQWSDMHRVGMASRAIVGLVEVYFVFRVLVQELKEGMQVRPDREENERERTHVAARPVTPEPTIATRMLSNCLDTGYVYSVLCVLGKFVAVYKPTSASVIKLTQVYLRRLHGLLGERMISLPIAICDSFRYCMPVTCNLRLEQGKKKEKLHIRRKSRIPWHSTVVGCRFALNHLT